MLKTLLFLLIIQQPTFENHRTMQHGITMQKWISTDTANGVFCLAETSKISDYVDIKIKIVNRAIISPVFIETNKGKFAIPVYDISKNGYSILRLYFRLSEQWVSIDSGITFITVKTDKNTYQIKLNDNLSTLKNFANEK